MGVLSSLVTLLATTTSSLDQPVTNGLSLLGTLGAHSLPKFLSDVRLVDGSPWGDHNCTNTNPYKAAPDTGVVRKYDFTISRGILSPDGYERSLLLVNGQYPAPTIEANWGDTIEVTVTNNITGVAEGTSVHWHGFLQHQSQWMDGTPGFTQCPIAPQKTFTYQFRAELFGTSWYHAHYSAQYTDGVVGAVVVYGPTPKDYDIDIGPILLSDWYHVDYYTTVRSLTAARPGLPPPQPTSDNNLINGKMNFDCSVATNTSVKCSSNAGLSKFKFQSGKTHRLRLINTGADASQQFSIDNHTMTVIANDFVPVQPYNTTVVTLGIGQRTDVIVEADGDSHEAYWIRSNATCAKANQPYALAVLYYENADVDGLPKSSPWNSPSIGCANDPLETTVPMYAINPGEPAETTTLNMTVGQNATGHWLWYMNNSSFRTDYNQPVLLLAEGGNTSYPDSPEWNVVNTGSASSYRFIVNNDTPTSHPMHFHGHNMYILAVGTGVWDGTIVRPDNPQRRDVQNVPANGYLVWQADADNPGTWPFHCHIAWHASTGLSVDILENPGQIEHLAIPEASYQLCQEWQTFSATGQVDQIDSGLRL
ncbi:hypothetical protein A1O3_03561 [Capronia epimyces CBS 606.96]|uniref:Laccase n=1 Tax=Capronia epimyces CBS 606.96 TaxID=1182542 RepID=W9Y282_9EURO|nr:uncharacterized protein A1O3_03561 [Capronia epimyces CBS 606.96]EXJ86608.1 hypothetical protein A1O3_03561 [Capronia epimyces CBS 606.96]